MFRNPLQDGFQPSGIRRFRRKIQVGRFKATTFEELFQGIKNLPWEEYIPEDGKFWVKKASSINSKLFSPSDIQSIAKKAMVERMKQKYHKEWFKEDGAAYPVRIFLLKDEVTVALDTSGDSLHKRGYRTMTIHNICLVELKVISLFHLFYSFYWLFIRMCGIEKRFGISTHSSNVESVLLQLYLLTCVCLKFL